MQISIKDYDSSGKYGHFLRIPLSEGIWGNFYGRHDFSLKVLKKHSSSSSISEYIVHIKNDGVNITTNDIPNCDLAYKITGNYIDLYIRLQYTQKAQITIDNDKMTPIQITNWDTNEDSLIVAIRNGVTSRIFIDETDYKADIYFSRHLNNLVYVDGSVQLKETKNITFTIKENALDISLIPKTSINLIGSNKPGNIVIQILTDNTIKCVYGGEPANYYINGFYKI